MGLRGACTERRCAGVVDAAAVASGEMNEDSLDDLGRLDARDDAQRAATHGAVFDVDVQDALEPLHPAHGGRRRIRNNTGDTPLDLAYKKKSKAAVIAALEAAAR